MYRNCFTANVRCIRMCSFIKLIFPLHLLLLCSIIVNGQQPGGRDIPGPRLWIVTELQGGNYKWVDRLDNTRLQSDYNSQPNFTINFHPALSFNNGIPKYILSNVSPVLLFGIFYPARGATTTDSLYTVTVNGAPFLKMKTSSIIPREFNESTFNPDFNVSTNNWATSMKPLAGYYSTLPAQRMHTAAGNQRQSELLIGMKGYWPEVLIYEQPLSDSALWKVATYFAIKYGTTLNGSYLGSDGTILWEKPRHTVFHNRVCAIGVDSMGALLQYKSNTTYEDPGPGDPPRFISFNSPSHNIKFPENTDSTSFARSVTIGFDKADRSKIPDKSFLFWGDNDGAFDTVHRKYAEGKITLVKRKWLMTNDSKLPLGTRAELSGNLLQYLKQPNQVYFLVKEDGNLDSTDFFVLTESDKQEMKFSRGGIPWPNAIDTFLFGSADKMDQEYRMCRNKKICFRGDDEFVYKRNNFLFIRNCTRRRIGYKYRTSSTPPVKRCSVPPLVPGELEFYFSGGVGPFRIFLDGAETAHIKTGDDTYTINGVANGKHTLTIQDAIRQQFTLKINAR